MTTFHSPLENSFLESYAQEYFVAKTLDFEDTDWYTIGDDSGFFNTDRSDFIVPTDRLTLSVYLIPTNPEKYGLTTNIETIRGVDEVVDFEDDHTWISEASPSRLIKYEFSPKSEGIHEITLKIIFRDLEKDETIFKKTESISFEVLSLSDTLLINSNQLLAEANSYNFRLYAGIFLTAVAANIISIIYFRIQNNQTKKQLKITLAQLEQTKKTDQLAFGPVIHGRYSKQRGFPQLLIDNVGNGPALDLKLTIKTLDKKEILDTVKRLVLAPNDPLHITKVDLGKIPEVLLEGTYNDASREPQSISLILRYPHMTEVNNDQI